MRATCIGLAACLAVSTPGCRTAEERAEMARNRVKIGMTRDKVADVLGEPYGWKEEENGQEIWLYAYRPSVGHYLVWGTLDFTELLVKAALVVGMIVGLAWLTKGGLPAIDFDDPGPVDRGPSEESKYQRYTFRVGFERESGRVAFVSSPFPE